MGKYYGGTLEGLSQAMLALAEAHVSFIVAGRVDEESDIFVSASDITDRDTHPVLSILDQAGYPHMFLPIPDSHFRVDLSSSSLRATHSSNDDDDDDDDNDDDDDDDELRDLQPILYTTAAAVIEDLSHV